MPNLMMEINDLKGMPDQALQFELVHPSGAIPAYLILAEAQRRQTMRQAAQAQQSEQPVGSVYDDVIRDMMARQPAPGVAPAGMTPPPMAPPASPAAGNFSMPAPGKPMGMAEGGEVDDDSEDDNGDDSGGVQQFDLNSAITASARKWGRDPNELYDMVRRESRGDPDAVSPKGATGLAQFMPDTAKQYGVDPNDPGQSIDGMAHYLSDLDRMFHGDQRLVHAAYNFGPGNVKAGKPWPKETQDYVKGLERDAAKRGDSPFLPGHPESLPTGPMTFAGPYRDYTPPPELDEDESEDESGDEGEETPEAPVGPEPPEIPVDRLLSQVDPSTLEGQQAMALWSPPDIGPRPAAPAPQSTGPSAAAPSVAAPVQAKTDAAADEFAASRQKIQEMYDDLKKRQHPSIWTFLRDFGAGMAATPARNWQQSLAGGVTGMIKSRETDEEAARQEQLKLLGVSLDLDKQVREHQDKIEQLKQQAANQAATHSYNIAKDNMAKLLNGREVLGTQPTGQAPPGTEVIDDQERPGFQYVVTPWRRVTQDMIDRHLTAQPLNSILTPAQSIEIDRALSAKEKPATTPAAQETQDLRAESLLAKLNIKRDPTVTPTEQLRREHPEMLAQITSPLKAQEDAPAATVKWYVGQVQKDAQNWQLVPTQWREAVGNALAGAGVDIKRLDAATRALEAPQDPNEVNYWTDQIINDPKNLTLISGNKGLTEAVRKNAASRGIDMTQMDAQMRDTAEFAHAGRGHIAEIAPMIDNLDKKGKLGPLLGRWNDFMAGKWGSGDPDYTQLRNNINLLNSAMARIHGGARGGGSPAMIDYMKKMLSAGFQDAPTMRAGLGVLDDWMKGYEAFNPKYRTKETPQPATQSGAWVKGAVDNKTGRQIGLKADGKWYDVKTGQPLQ